MLVEFCLLIWCFFLLPLPTPRQHNRKRKNLTRFGGNLHRFALGKAQITYGGIQNGYQFQRKRS